MYHGAPRYPREAACGKGRKEKSLFRYGISAHPCRIADMPGLLDSQGQPRPVTDSKGKRRRPGSKNLAAVLKCDDPLFVDFIAKCLTWDPERRLKPSTAMQHPWILASKKIRVGKASVYTPTAQTNRTTSTLNEVSTFRDRDPAKKMSNGHLTSGTRIGDHVSVPLSTSSKSSSSRHWQQDTLKARISKPSPLSPKEKSSFSGFQQNTSLLPSSRQPADGTAIKVRQLTGKTYKTPV